LIALAGGRFQALDDDRDQRHDQQWQNSIERMMDHSGQLRLQRARLELQCIDRGTVDFGRELQFTPRWRSRCDHEQDCGKHEVERAEDRCCCDRAPDLDQRKIGR
jgi:hypothetical protein